MTVLRPRGLERSQSEGRAVAPRLGGNPQMAKGSPWDVETSACQEERGCGHPGTPSRGRRGWVLQPGGRPLLEHGTEPDPGQELGRGWQLLSRQAGGPGARAGHRWQQLWWAADWAGSGLPVSW